MTDAALQAADIRRIDDLLAAMTPAEKAGQLTQYFSFPAGQVGPGDDSEGPTATERLEAAIERGEVGSLLFVTDPAEIDRLQKAVVAGNRHGVPALFGFDVIHGLRTILPVPIALAASWDPALIEQGQAVAAREARAVGIHWAFAPMVDIARDPRWGRIVEGAGEDPYLGAAVAAAQVRGFQGSHLGADEHVIAGPKHFAGYGAAVGGRDYDEVELSDSEFHNVYLPPFRAAIEAGAGNVMSAYMDLNGIPASGNRWLLDDVLRGELGFTGFVVSDANAVKDLETHHFARDPQDAAARALAAGVDMEMAVVDPAYPTLPEALATGALDTAVLDTAVRRVLEAKARLGLLEGVVVDGTGEAAAPSIDLDRADEVLADPAHREVARVAAERSAVLLTNDGVLPLDAATVGSVAVIGPLADSPRDTIGPWVFDYDLDETVTVLEGVRRYAGDAATVTHAPGIRPAQRHFPSMFDMFPGNAPVDPEGFDDDAEFAAAVDAARMAEVAVVVVGEWQNMIGESASRSSLELPGRQQELLEAVVGTGTPVVARADERAPARRGAGRRRTPPPILDVWYPGTRGGEAVANLLFGVVSPAGRLPFTWPRTVGQVPIIAAHTRSHQPENQGRRYWDEESTPLFAFGHGLSYSTFEYGAVSVAPSVVALGETATISVDVANTGERECDEVVQLYLHQRFGAASRPVRELKGFARVALAPGETRTVSFEVGPDELRYWNAGLRDWTQDATTLDVAVGGSSATEFTATLEVRAD